MQYGYIKIIAIVFTFPWSDCYPILSSFLVNYSRPFLQCCSESIFIWQMQFLLNIVWIIVLVIDVEVFISLPCVSFFALVLLFCLSFHMTLEVFFSHLVIFVDTEYWDI